MLENLENSKNQDASFYLRTVRILLSHLRRFNITRKEDLEDIVQSTYLEAYKNLSRLKSKEAEISWLLTIGRRQMGRFLESKKRTIDLDSIIKTSEEDKQNPSDLIPDQSYNSLEDRTEASLFCHDLLKIIKEIKNQEIKKVVTLFYFYGFSLKEISEKTGTNPSTLTTWLARFRLLVKDNLQQFSPEAKPCSSNVLNKKGVVG